MLRTAVVVLALAACLLGITSGQLYGERYRGEKVFRIFPRTEEQVRKLVEIKRYQNHGGALDFWKDPSTVDAPVDVRVKAGSIGWFQDFLKTNNLENDVHINDVQNHLEAVEAINRYYRANRADANSIVGTYASQADINTWLTSLCQMYPKISSCGTWGSSYQGRDMRYIKLGRPGINKKIVYVYSGMHAREWLGPATVVWIIDRLTSNYTTDPIVMQMLNIYDWYFQPVVNPDGYEFSRSPSGDRMWRKTRSPTSDPTCFGVDGNRNYPFHWDGTGSPCDEDYPGAKSVSEVEVANIMKFVTSQNQSLGLGFYSLHTYSNLWLLPYSWAKGVYPSDFDEMMRVANTGVNAIMAVGNQTWQAGNVVDLLYVATGDSMSWWKGVANVTYTYGLELRGDSFVVPESEIVPSGREIYAGLLSSVNSMMTK